MSKTGQHKPVQESSELPPVSIDHYENFPVASVLCPPRIRPAVVAIYHFARTADDLADEGPADHQLRLADLAAYRDDLRAVYRGQPAGPRWSGVFLALAAQIQRFDLPQQPLHDLLDAFEQDVRNPSYADRSALLAYCAQSANPVGRLLLHLYGVRDAIAIQQSDAICTALQLINFWQDLSVDTRRGRHYVPKTDLTAVGLQWHELIERADDEPTRRLVQGLCDWAGALMRQGAPLALSLPGRAGWELRLVVQGGLQILEKIARMDHATLTRRPTLTALDAMPMLWRAARMQSRP